MILLFAARWHAHRLIKTASDILPKKNEPKNFVEKLLDVESTQQKLINKYFA